MSDNGVFYKAGARIRSRREELGMTMEKLGEVLGVHKSTIKRYEDGSTKRITIATFEKIGEVLNIDPKYLMGFVDEKSGVIDSEVAKGILEKEGHDISNFDDKNEQLRLNQNSNSVPFSIKKLNPIPILGVIRAGVPIYASSDIEGYTYVDYGDKENYFALRVVGDSMNKVRICQGDIVIVRRQNYVENGEIAVVLIDDENATLKKVYYNDEMITLMPQSTNADNKPIVVDPKETKFEILGKVIKVEFKI